MELEDCLSLDELMELYGSSMERQNRLMKVIAAAMGADVSDDREDQKVNKHLYDPAKGGQLEDASTGNDVAALPINVGYTKI